MPSRKPLATIPHSSTLEWAMLESNQRPTPCKGGTRVSPSVAADRKIAQARRVRRFAKIEGVADCLAIVSLPGVGLDSASVGSAFLFLAAGI
jgi:hypothetical protein